MTRDEEQDRKITRRTALKKGAMAAGVFTVGGTPASTAAAVERTGTGVLRKRDFESGYEIGSILTAVETVDDIVVEQPAGLQGAQKLEEANLIKRPLYFERSNNHRGSTVLTEFWPSNGVADIGSKLKITDVEELSAEATLKLQGPNGIVEATSEPMVKVSFEKLQPSE